MKITIRNVSIEDYDSIYELWISTEQSRRALNPVDDSRDGIDRYLRRNPTTCFLACPEEDPRHVIGVILTGHDGRRAIIHHMCVHPEYRRHGIARQLLSRVVEEARAYGCGAVQITASDMGVLLYTNFGFVKNGNFMQLKL